MSAERIAQAPSVFTRAIRIPADLRNRRDDPLRSAARAASINFIVLAAAEIVSRLISFGIMVYVARIVGAEAYGALGVATAISLYATTLGNLGVDFHGPRAVAKKPENVNVLVPSVLAGRAVLAILLAIAVGIVGLVLPHPEGSILIACSLLLVPQSLNTAWSHLGLERSLPVAISRVSGEIVRGLMVLGMVVQPSHVVRVPLAQSAGEVLSAIILLYALHRRVHLWRSPQARVALSFVRRAVPLMWTSILGLMIYNSDLLMLRIFDDNMAVGIYVCAYLPVSLVGLIEGRYRAAMIPPLTRLENRRSEQIWLFLKSLRQGLTMALPVTLVGYFVGPAVINSVFGSSYEQAGDVFRILLFMVPLLWIRGVCQGALVARGKNHLVLRITLVVAASNIILNLLLIPRFGVSAAAISAVVTEFLRMVLAMICVREVGLGLPSGVDVAVPVVAAGAMWGTLLLITVEPPWLWLSISMSMATYVVTLLLLQWGTTR